MHVVVVGCGRVGAGLAVALRNADHTVAIIDRHKEAFHRLPEGFDGRCVAGVGFDKARLHEAGIEEAAGAAAVTSGDNSNIVIARIAREHFNVPRVVARIYDVRRAAIYERLGISTVATVGWTVERVLRRILPDTTEFAWVDPSARVCLVERALPATRAGRPVAEIELETRSRVVAVSRLGVAQLPTKELVGQEGDVIWVAVSEDAIDEFDRHLAAAGGGH